MQDVAFCNDTPGFISLYYLSKYDLRDKVNESLRKCDSAFKKTAITLKHLNSVKEYFSSPFGNNPRMQSRFKFLNGEVTSCIM